MNNLPSLLEEIRSRAERPTKHMKDDVLLLLGMITTAIEALDYCADNVDPINNAALAQKYIAMRAVCRQAREEIAKGKGDA